MTINPDLPIFIQMEMEARSGLICIGRSGNVRIEFIGQVSTILIRLQFAVSAPKGTPLTSIFVEVGSSPYVLSDFLGKP
jgi:hypothetical protein